jgi:TonB family protein
MGRDRFGHGRSDSIAIAIVISFLFHSLLVLAAVFFAASRGSALSLFQRLASRAVEVEIAPRPGPEPVQLPVSALPRPAPPLTRLEPPPERDRPQPSQNLTPEPKPVPPPEPKPEPKAEEVRVELVPVQPSRLKMVEVQNQESDQPPENARFLSDKNRRVAEETRALHTNLEKDHPRPAPSSDPDGKQGKTPGGKEERIAETREQRSRPGSRARAPREGARLRPSPLLGMRKAGAPGALSEKPGAASAEGVLPAVAPSPGGEGGEGGRARRSRAGPDLRLDHRSLDRIDGQAAKQARELARLSPSVHKGKFDRKWQAVRSALENFIPEVKPGNQTALGTRADPFAVYIARMHRNIHKLWGFGFLVDLDLKPDSHPMNNMRMWTMIEVVVRPGGEVDKATIVRPSGYLPYDVAALDTVLSSSPYPPTPRAIRSADGKVYLHWRFHRDQRQCGTFGVDPFILTTPPRGPVDNPYGEVKGDAGTERQLRRLHRAPTARPPRVVTPPPTPRPAPAGSSAGGSGSAPPTGAAEQARVDPRDPAARALLGRFLAAFSSGNARGMAAACGFPFLAHGRKTASHASELERQLGDLVREAGGRRAAVLRLLTVVQARAAFGRQPAGTEHGSSQLVAELLLGKLQPVLILERRAKSWLVVGINR